ncbi:diphthine--ammonia ligase [Bacillus sp. V59.32b]|nr:diphthine--ammonia ligase [Bacillus sp. V59.32b]RFU68691.1 diphthine--ammonia ligase [Bacillus sp. V59.32b]
MMKNIAISWSGGKDGCMALHRLIEQGNSVKCLFTTLPEDIDGRTFGHGEKAESINLQGEALGIPVEFIHCSFKTYTEDVKNALIHLRNKYGLDAVAFGDLYLQEHRDWGEKVCEQIGLDAVYPLWMLEDEVLPALKMFVESGYKATVIRIRDDKLPVSWLGRELDGSFFADIQKEDVCPMGEAGEYHTYVYDGPLFQRKIEFSYGEILQLETTKRMEIDDLKLVMK